MDAVAGIYRIAASLSPGIDALRSHVEFHRRGRFYATITLHDGRTFCVVRQGLALQRRSLYARLRAMAEYDDTRLPLRKCYYQRCVEAIVLSSDRREMSRMVEMGPAPSRRTRTRNSYASQWNSFVAWSEASGRRSLPAAPEDVAAYLEDRSESGARPSTLRVAAFAIARNHEDAGFDVPVHHGVARTALDELTRDDAPVPVRALPLDLDCYLAIRKTAHQPRWGRGGRLERATSARRRGEMDVAMIGLMRDARLRVSETAELTWGDIERVRGGSGRVRVVEAEEADYREVSADTMKRLWPIRRGTGDDEPVLGMRPNQIATRIGAAARQARSGRGLLRGQPPAGHDQGPGNPRRASGGRLRSRERTLAVVLPSVR